MSKKIKKVCLIIALAAFVSGSYYAYTIYQNPAKLISKLIEEKSPDQITEAVVLAIKGINLTQGEGGVEFWRLKASWAGMHQKDGTVDIDEPRVQYAMGDGKSDDFVLARSKLGRITDNQEVLTMWDDVEVTRGTSVVTGSKMVYTSSDRTLRFPNGAKLVSDTFDGYFGTLSWDMATNVIEGQQLVDVEIKAKKED